jgi:uncharacterized repeat protein (TIGR03803 family)
MGRIVEALGKLTLCAAAVVALPAQTFTTLANFNLTNGAVPQASLVQGVGGDFYGTTYSGGGAGCEFYCGTVFKITPGGALTTLHVFDGADGGNPFAGLVQATDGTFYGTTSGGASIGGTVFRITPEGSLTTLYTFGAGWTDDHAPYAALVQGTNGDFYGTTAFGGAGIFGTVFEITPGGTLTTLYSFGSGAHGDEPYAGLVQGIDGNFYGTNALGGAYRQGTVFKVTPEGALTTLHTFDVTGGAGPYAGLVQATDGNFYGTTTSGASSNGGTIFKITSGGDLTTLYSFCSQSTCADGGNPTAGVVQATDGNFYGTTAFGGANGRGTIFRITPGGTLTTLHSFPSSDGGAPPGPTGGLLQATDGNFYGTTATGGPDNDGTVFKLDVGLGPFVKTLPHFGAAGAAISILGTDLTGATSVSFNGTPAAFEVVSATEIRTAVPAGATTGVVQVTTPGGTLKSGGPFLVTP